MSYNYGIIDMREEPLEDVVERFKTLMRGVGGSTHKGDYYCGIATDPDDRFRDHEQNHWSIKRIVGVIDCGTKQRCIDVETLMDDDGFDTHDAPGNGVGDDTRYVYLVEKGNVIC